MIFINILSFEQTKMAAKIRNVKLILRIFLFTIMYFGRIMTIEITIKSVCS